MNWRTRIQQWFYQPANSGQKRRFEGARIGRLESGWQTTERSINKELQQDLNALRSRGRDLINNNDYARRFRQSVQNNLIGPKGVVLQSRVNDGPGKPDRLACAAIESAWQAWGTKPTANAGTTLRGLCETLVGGLPSDGEFLVVMVRGAAAKNKFNFALQAIDVDRIATRMNLQPGRYNNAICMGIEINAMGVPVAIHVHTNHPGDSYATTTTTATQRLDMADVLHVFKSERAGQLRGVPWMASGLITLYHLGAFMQSALLAAENGANHFGFFQQREDSAPPGPDGLDGQQAIATSVPGMYDTLPPGYTFQAHESAYPNTTFGPFVKTLLQRVASGWGVSYNSLANDLENVNFSSIRAGTVEERDRWACDQTWFIDQFLEPVFQEWLTMALLSGAIMLPNGSTLPAAKRDKFAQHEWQARRWEWVDPKSDTISNIERVRAGFASPQDIAASNGKDFETVLAQISEAKKLADAYGVELHAYDATPGALPKQPAQADDKTN